jgi:ribosomal protein S18 acetylase RimI-like enzyme
MKKAIDADVRIKVMRTRQDFADVGTFFREYAQWLRIDGNFPDLEVEIANLPGQYASPSGEVFLAADHSGTAVGCVAVRPLEESGRCEMKRLYVRQAGRSRGAGRALADAAVAFASVARYHEMLLDTLPSMKSAISIYRALGFEEVEPYYASPGPGALYFRKLLSPR